MPTTNDSHDTRKHILRLDNVNKSYIIGRNEVPVLHDANMHIYPREYTILYGPSGSGKSTLMNTMIGLEAPTTGTVYINGRDISKMQDDDRAKYRNENIGVVYQQSFWVKTLSVIENVALPLMIGGRDESYALARATYALSQVGMGDFAKRSPLQLSGGQQQKVSIARALVSDPSIIMTDEPTGNLDTTSSDDIIKLLTGLVLNYGRTVVMVTHELRFLRLADRAYLIRDGYIQKHYDKVQLTELLKDFKQTLTLEDAS